MAREYWEQRAARGDGRGFEVAYVKDGVATFPGDEGYVEAPAGALVENYSDMPEGVRGERASETQVRVVQQGTGGGVIAPAKPEE